MAECEVCGRTLRTGRKYCYEHRRYSSGESGKINERLKEVDNKRRVGYFLIMSGFLLLLISVPNLKEGWFALTLAIILIFFGVRNIIKRDKEEINIYQKQNKENE